MVQIPYNEMICLILNRINCLRSVSHMFWQLTLITFDTPFHSNPHVQSYICIRETTSPASHLLNAIGFVRGELLVLFLRLYHVPFRDRTSDLTHLAQTNYGPCYQYRQSPGWPVLCNRVRVLCREWQSVQGYSVLSHCWAGSNVCDVFRTFFFQQCYCMYLVRIVFLGVKNK